MRFRNVLLLALGLIFVALPAAAGDLNTSGRCPSFTSCNIGDSAKTQSITLTTDGADLDLDGTSNTLTLSTTDGASAVFTGKDASGSSVTVYDTTANGSIIMGSADVLSVTITTDGGDITLDGAIIATKDIRADTGQVSAFGAPDQLFTSPGGSNQFIGIPKLNVTQLGASMPNGPILADPYSPLIGVCAPTNGSEAAGVFRITGAASYQYTGASTAADNDGFDCDVTGHAVTGTDSIAFWFRSDTALTAGTLDISLLDASSVEANANMPAITTTDEWQWIEIDFGSDCDATCADVDGVLIAVTSAGAATSEMDGAIIHVDSGVFWLDAAEEAIGNVLVGGVINVSVAVSAFGTDNTASELVEYTDYFVNYQTGADALVFITDQSANYGWTLEALNQ